MSTLQPTVNAASAASIPAPAAPATPAVSAKTWIAVIGATLGAFMAVLNIQIVNASLADIQGAIGAGIDDGGWISTSYLIAEIVVIPLSGWLAQVFSIRIYLLTNAVLFLVLSAACALAQDLPQMIVLRAVQGFTGGVLIPMAFTLIITLLPRAKQPVGLALFALSATFAPAIGPTIGGYLTENFGWQYIFYVNVVPGRDHGRHALVCARRQADEAVAAARRRLGRHHHHGDRPVRAPDRAGRGQQGRLVRLALHRQAVRHRGRSAGRVPDHRADREEAAAEPAPAGPPQFRLRHARELPARRRALWFGVHPAAISIAHPGLQLRADRHGAGMDRIAATAADPAGAPPDAEFRRADHHRHRLRPVRGLQLHEHLHDERLWLPTSCCGPTSSARSARRSCWRRCRPWQPPASRRRMQARPPACST